MGDRRQSPDGHDKRERRRSDRRRVPPMQWGQMNYMIATEASM